MGTTDFLSVGEQGEPHVHPVRGEEQNQPSISANTGTDPKTPDALSEGGRSRKLPCSGHFTKERDGETDESSQEFGAQRRLTPQGKFLE